MNNMELYSCLQQENGYHGFRLAETHYIEELQCDAWLLRHQSGAEAVYLNAPDQEKTYSLSFKTIPTDSTGVFHIIEHTILCGSQKYNVRHWGGDGLLTTFYSAFTMRGTSMYPVCSDNEASFQKLVRVCADAVFRPLLTETPMSFLQEGRHFSYDPDADRLTCSGIVYSEMMASNEMPEFMLADLQLRAAARDSTFAFNMGGAPEAIPHLTYEQFKDAYLKTFIPENCLIYIYGDTCLAHVLDTTAEYLDRYPKTGAAFSVSGSPSHGPACPVIEHYPLPQGESEEGRDYLGFNWVLKGGHKTAVTADVLTTLLQMRLAKAFPAMQPTAACFTDYYWPMVSITLRNASAADMDSCRIRLHRLLEELSQEGFTAQELKSALTAYQLKRSETVTFVPEGVSFGISATCGWAKGERPWTALEYQNILSRLQNCDLNLYFKKFLKTQFLENDYSSELILKAAAGLSERRKLAEAERMEQLRRAMTEEELAAIHRKAAALHDYQTAEDDPKAAAALPKTSLSDLPEKAPVRYPSVRNTSAGPVLFVEKHSASLTVTLHYSPAELSEKECSLCGILCLLMGHLRTRSFTAEAFDSLRHQWIGSLSLYPMAYSDKASDYLKFQLQFETFPESFADAQHLVRALLEETVFDDPAAIKGCLEAFAAAYAAQPPAVGDRAAAYYSHSAAAMEHVCGVEFYQYVTALLSDYENRSAALCRDLQAMAKKLFQDSVLTAGLSCRSAVFDEIAPQLLFKSAAPVNTPWHTPLPAPREAFRIPGNMQSVAIGSRLPAASGCLRTACLLAQNAATTQIRQIGGAYTVKFCLTPEKDLLCMTGRDPHLAQTLAHYRNAPQTVREASDQQIREAAVTAASAFAKNSPAGKVGFLSHNSYDDTVRNYFNGITPELQQKHWEALIHAEPQQVRACADLLEKALEADCYCAAASSKKLEKDGGLFDRILAL